MRDIEKINVFFLPFAGGSKYSFRDFVKQAPPTLNIIPIELPGRGTRYNEVLLESLPHMTEDVYNQLKYRLDTPYAIYGHSMGTIIAYLLTVKLIARQYTPPMHLFVSGADGPSRWNQLKSRHLLPKNEFFQEIQSLGGVNPEILSNQELVDFFEPILRADFKACDTFFLDDPQKINVPVTVLLGTNDHSNAFQGKAWQEVSHTDILIQKFEGDHFFIFDHETEILKLIEKKLISKFLHNEQ